MADDFHPFDVPLRDGRAVHIRAMSGADEDELLQAFDRMDSDARYMRFMRAVREPNLARLRKVLASFPADGYGIVATIPAADGFDIAGSAIFVLCDDATRCEFAISVNAAYAGAHLGGMLLTTLIGVAKRRGLQQMEGIVLAGNRPMLRLAARLGFAISPDPDDHSLRICRLQLRDSIGAPVTR